jgi:hypothetical protein
LSSSELQASPELPRCRSTAASSHGVGGPFRGPSRRRVAHHGFGAPSLTLSPVRGMACEVFRASLIPGRVTPGSPLVGFAPPAERDPGSAAAQWPRPAPGPKAEAAQPTADSREVSSPKALSVPRGDDQPPGLPRPATRRLRISHPLSDFIPLEPHPLTSDPSACAPGLLGRNAPGVRPSELSPLREPSDLSVRRCPLDVVPTRAVT